MKKEKQRGLPTRNKIGKNKKGGLKKKWGKEKDRCSPVCQKLLPEKEM